MNYVTIDGIVRKLWASDAQAYGDHLQRLDEMSRRNRFGGTVADAFIRGHAERAFEPEIRAVLQALAADGRVLEMNTKGPLASAQLLSWWREAGGTAVSFGSDAHQPWRVGDRFKLAVDMAEAAGFRAGRDPFDFWRV